MRPHAVFRLVATIALAAASQPMPDTFCFDHGGAPTGREIAGPGGTRAALLPYREIVESFGKKVTPLASLSVDANGDGRVPAACYEAGEIGLKAPYGLKLAPCGVEDHLELLSICLALCDREPDCDAAHARARVSDEKEFSHAPAGEKNSGRSVAAPPRPEARIVRGRRRPRPPSFGRTRRRRRGVVDA